MISVAANAPNAMENIKPCQAIGAAALGHLTSDLWICHQPVALLLLAHGQEQARGVQ